MEIKQRKKLYLSLFILMIAWPWAFLLFIKKYVFFGPVGLFCMAFILFLCLFFDKELLKESRSRLFGYKTLRWIFLIGAILMIFGTVALLVLHYR